MWDSIFRLDFLFNILYSILCKIFSFFSDFKPLSAEIKITLMKSINHGLKGNQIDTTPYNPRSNGLVENYNSTLKDQPYC